MPTIDEFQTQVRQFEGKALKYVKSAQAPVVDYVGKVAGSVADALPADRPELLDKSIDAAVFQAGFAKKVLDTETAFAKAVIDAAVKPFAPAKRRAVKAA